jgi:hypothetical protein
MLRCQNMLQRPAVASHFHRIREQARYRFENRAEAIAKLAP